VAVLRRRAHRAHAAQVSVTWEDQSVPATLPLLDALVAERVGDEQPLSDVTAVLIQHQLGSIVPLTRTLIRLGMDPHRIHWVDIPYTTNDTVRRELVGLGIPASNFAPSDYHLELPYAPYQRARVQELAVRLRGSIDPDETLLVLDDGSYFIEAMSCFAGQLPSLRIVEQTTRGIIKIDGDASIREYSERSTIVNVAQCRPKKTIEGPLIGQAVCRALLRELDGRLPDGSRTRCLVLGFGQIGQSVAAALVDHTAIPPHLIHVMDPSPDAQAAAAAAGFVVWDRRFPERRRFGLVVGCSGTTSFGPGDRVFLEDGAILASASSGSAELSREGFIELADTHRADDIYVYDREDLHERSLHSSIRIHLVDRAVTFLNGGFPVNFDGAVNCVPPRFIQATHALQVGAALEARTATRQGLLPVSDDLCCWVEDRFRQLVEL
jgi:S-adenosylhomocysteine hydrolase